MASARFNELSSSPFYTMCMVFSVTKYLDAITPRWIIGTLPTHWTRPPPHPLGVNHSTDTLLYYYTDSTIALPLTLLVQTIRAWRVAWSHYIATRHCVSQVSPLTLVLPLVVLQTQGPTCHHQQVHQQSNSLQIVCVVGVAISGHKHKLKLRFHMSFPYAV